jgi:hypothetical protein
MSIKPLFRNNQGLIQQIQDGAIINIGGTSWPSFTVNGIGIILEDGTSTTGGSSLNLQTIYNNSIDSSNNASIKLITGRDLIIYDDTNNSIFFKIDSETGKVTITGDLEVAGSSVLVDSIIQDSDHWRISPASSITTALKIEPEFNSPLVDLVSIKNVLGGPIIFKIDKDGNTYLKKLNVSTDIDIIGNINISGLVDGVDISALELSFNSLSTLVSNIQNDISLHITPSTTTKHASTEISVIPPSYAPGTTNVQQVLDALESLIGSGGGGGSSAGLFIIDVTPTTSGIVGNKQYVTGTIPANAVISQATTDVDAIRIHLLVEGNSTFYSPTVSVDTIPGPSVNAILSEHPTDKRLFIGYADILVTSSRTVYVSSSIGVNTSVNIIRAGPGPIIHSLTVGPYPGSQTAAKAGDIMNVTGTVENQATYLELIAGGAVSSTTVMTLGANDSGGPGLKTFSGSFVVSGLSGLQNVSAKAHNSLGTFGPVFSSSPITLDQIYPSFSSFTVTYPPGQGALKGSESATVTCTVTNHTSVVYSGTNISIASPTTYTVSKTVTRTGGSYIDSGTNYTITATRASNGAVSTASTLVKIANSQPTISISISGSPLRLRSSPSGNNYTINIVSSQNLSSPPVLTATSGVLSSFTGSGKNWTGTITIHDSDTKGNNSFNISSIINEALVSGNTITSGQNYIVGGFLNRSITYPAFSRFEPIGTYVTDINKTIAKYSGTNSNLTLYFDTGDHFQGYTIVSASGTFDVNGTHLWISDGTFAGANTTGTLILEIQEVE